jgi:hypothetical protein
LYNQDETKSFFESLNKKNKNKSADKHLVEAVLKIGKEQRLKNDEFWNVYASLSNKRPTVKYEKISKPMNDIDYTIAKYCAPQ